MLLLLDGNLPALVNNAGDNLFFLAERCEPVERTLFLLRVGDFFMKVELLVSSSEFFESDSVELGFFELFELDILAF